jgi:hypothetical protein
MTKPSPMPHANVQDAKSKSASIATETTPRIVTMILDSAGTGAPGDEIEITPEMIHAGIMAMLTHDPEHYTLDEIIRAVWDAMIALKPRVADNSDSRSLRLKHS